MVFTKFVEIGRVAMINYGAENGKLCVIINLLDMNKALVDGPKSLTGVSRQIIGLSRLTLTDFVVKIPVNARIGVLTKAVKAAGIVEKFAETPIAKKMALQKKRANATDFDRFKVMVARKTRSKLVKTKLASLRKKAAPAATKAPAAAKKA